MNADSTPREISVRRLELPIALVLTAWIFLLHLRNLFDAGPLWRDEIGTVDYAAMPSMADIWRNLGYDNFPPLVVALARIWISCGFSSDFSFRILGFLIGIGTLAVMWYGARQLGARMPFLVLAMFAANPLAIRVGDSLRPYGLGIALVMLASALIWKFVENPTTGKLAGAVFAATISVHCLYQNAFFIAAFCCGAWMVTLRRNDWKIARQIGIIAVIPAVSLLPYWNILKEGWKWHDVLRMTIHLDTLWESFSLGLQTAGAWMPFVCLALCLIGILAAVYYHGGQRQTLEYSGTVLVVSAALYTGFLFALRLAPPSWYFLILMAPAALMLDSILGELELLNARISRMVLCVILIAASIPNCIDGLSLRQTNVDLVAAKLKQSAKPGDFILVSPWYYGVALQRHLDSREWMTLPPMPVIKIHRFDLFKRAMMTENLIGPVLDKMQAALRSGHRLWLVGVVEPQPDAPPPLLPPYDESENMAALKYMGNWMAQIEYFTARHAAHGARVFVPVPEGLPVNNVENAKLRVFQGWKN